MVRFREGSFVLAMAVALVTSACSEKKEKEEASEDQPTEKVSHEPVPGGTFQLAIQENVSTLFPYQIYDLTTAQVGHQIYESLLQFDNKGGDVIPSLAEKWEVSEDQTVYTFHIKKGVFFHDNECFEGGKGREVTAEDVKFSFELLCTDHENGQNANFENTFKGIVKGASEFYNGQSEALAGVEVVDNHKVKLTINEPRSTFIYKLATLFTAIIPHEAYDMYGYQVSVGTGPFMLSSINETKDEVVLVRNPNYHVQDEYGNTLPYLDSVFYSAYPSKTAELDAFQAGELSVISGLPASKVSEVVQADIKDYSAQPPVKFLIRKPEMATEYYEFNMTSPAFNDVRVRRAFNHAIDRKKIIEEVMANQANGYGEFGITPPVPSFEGYDFKGIGELAYDYDPEKAKELLAEAGYENGEGFPSVKLILNSGGNRNWNVAKEVVKQLEKTLGVYVNYEILPFSRKIEESKYARSEMVRSAWIADYPSPETFLLNFYGRNVPAGTDMPSYPNTSRYVNPSYDELLEKGFAAKTKEDRYKYFAEAEKILIQDAPMMILWYTENYKLHQANVRKLDFTPLGILDLEGIYLKQWTEAEWKSSNNL